ncbi:MAG TPA: efflux RND transporter periplasmic adaptor subunit [Schlesneria sp.]|jgi:RND family efflux transporter MFP subunit
MQIFGEVDRRWSLLAILGIVAVAGCHAQVAKAPAPKPPEVFIASPVEEIVTETEEFTGRTMAVNTVEVRARVTGYLDLVKFEDGADVKVGDVLAEVDPRSYKAEVEKARATTAQAKARMDRFSRQLNRARQLIEKKTITQEVFESAESDHTEALATLDAAVASQDAAELNLAFTKITSPLDGQISRRLVDPGNLVKADDTPLATIVSLNKIHAYFDVDERTVLRIRRLIQQGKMKSARDSETKVKIGLADEEDFPLEGTVNFIDNQVDATTGTLRLRAIVENNHRFLAPGMFVRVQVPIGNPHPALMIREEALGADQGQRFVYVVNDKDEIAYRRVTVGMSRGGRRVIEGEISLQDRIVVSGLQRVRPGTKVAVRPFELPSDAAKLSASPPPATKTATAETKPPEHGKD